MTECMQTRCAFCSSRNCGSLAAPQGKAKWHVFFFQKLLLLFSLVHYRLWAGRDTPFFLLSLPFFVAIQTRGADSSRANQRFEKKHTHTHPEALFSSAVCFDGIAPTPKFGGTPSRSNLHGLQALYSFVFCSGCWTSTMKRI